MLNLGCLLLVYVCWWLLGRSTRLSSCKIHYLTGTETPLTIGLHHNDAISCQCARRVAYSRARLVHKVALA